MTTITEHTDDLLVVNHGIIVHGCNAQGKMNSGLAKAVRAMYPGAYDAYMVQYERNGLPVGQVVFYRVPPTPGAPDLIIANAITQKYYGREKGVLYVDYDGLERCFERIARTAKKFSLPVHFPLIGAGLANGDWGEIAQRIERALGPDIEKHLWRHEPAMSTQALQADPSLF